MLFSKDSIFSQQLQNSQKKFTIIIDDEYSQHKPKKIKEAVPDHLLKKKDSLMFSEKSGQNTVRESTPERRLDL